MTVPLRLLLVIDGLGMGGAERSLAERAVGLRDRGHGVTVAYQVDRPGVREELAAAGVPLVRLDGRRWVERARQLQRLVHTQRPDVVHSSLVSSNLMARLASWRTGVPCACSFTGFPYSEGALLAAHPVRRTLVRAADGWTARHLQAAGQAVTQEVAEHAVTELHLAPQSVTVIPRGRGRQRLGHPGPERRAAARHAQGLASDELLVVTLGRQEVVKAHALLVDAWAGVAARHPRARLVIAGREGAATPAIRAALGRLTPDARARVSLPGAIGDVGGLLAAADLFVLPSSVEGLPGALVEAMAMALPVVVTDLPTLREAVPSDRHAVTVRPGDPVALGEAISALLGNEARRHQMGEANLRRFEERFTLDRSLDAMESFYATVLGRSGPTGAVVDGLVEPAEQEAEPVERRRGVDPDP